MIVSRLSVPASGTSDADAPDRGLSLQLLDREVAAADDRKFLPGPNFGEPQVVRERESLVWLHPEISPVHLEISGGISGVLPEIFCGFTATGSSVVLYPLGETPKIGNCTEIELPGNFAAISATAASGSHPAEIFVATSDCEVLRFVRSPGNFEFVERFPVDAEISCAHGNFFGSVDGRVYEIRPASAAASGSGNFRIGNFKRARTAPVRELWRPLVTRFPLIRGFLGERVSGLEISPDRKFLWVQQGEGGTCSVWVLEISSGLRLGSVEISDSPVKKLFPTLRFRGHAHGGALVVCENGSRKFLLLDSASSGGACLSLRLWGARAAEPKAQERQLRVLDAALAQDTTLLLLATFRGCGGSGSGVGTTLQLGLVTVAPEVADSEFRELWDWRAELWSGDAGVDAGTDADWRGARLVATAAQGERANVAGEWRQPELLTHMVVAGTGRALWRTRLAVRRATRQAVRKFVETRNLHSLRQTGKRAGSETVASELLELIGNFSHVYSLAPQNADAEVARGAEKILFTAELARALELVDPILGVVLSAAAGAGAAGAGAGAGAAGVEEIISGFGYVDPQAAAQQGGGGFFSLKTLSPRFGGFARLAGTALRTLWTQPVLREKMSEGGFELATPESGCSGGRAAELQRALGSIRALASFGVSEISRFCQGVTPGEEQLVRNFLDTLAVLQQWLEIANSLEISDHTEEAGTREWSLRTLLSGDGEDVAKRLWLSGNLSPEISAPRIFTEKLLAEVTVEQTLLLRPGGGEISGRQVLQCEKLIGNFLMDCPKFPTLLQTLAQRGSLRGVVEILAKKIRASDAATQHLEIANLAIAAALEPLRAKCLRSEIPRNFRSMPAATVPLMADEVAAQDAWGVLSEISKIFLASAGPTAEVFHVAVTKWMMIGNFGNPEILKTLMDASPKFVPTYLRKKFPIALLETLAQDEGRVVEETRNLLAIGNLTKENFQAKKQLALKAKQLWPENAALSEICRKLEVAEELLQRPDVEEIGNFLDWKFLFELARERNLWKLATGCCMHGNLASDDFHLTKRLVELALRDCASKVQVEELAIKWAREIPAKMAGVVDALAKNLYMAGGTLSVFDVLMGETEISRHAIFKAVLMEEVISDRKDRQDLALAVVEQWLEELHRKKRSDKTEIVLYLADMDDLASRGFQIENLRVKARNLLSASL